MKCPRCQSERIQRDYDDAVFFLRAFGLHKLLCNHCGLVFKGFDPLGSHQREPSETKKEKARNRRRGPRYYAHLPSQISSLEEGVQVGKASYTQPSRGHCETISQVGMGLSLVGSRFTDAALARGRLLFVRVDLPEGPIESVVKIVTSERVGEEGKKKWVLGVNIHQIADADKERLTAYLDKRFKEVPVIISE